MNRAALSRPTFERAPKYSPSMENETCVRHCPMRHDHINSLQQPQGHQACLAISPSAVASSLCILGKRRAELLLAPIILGLNESKKVGLAALKQNELKGRFASREERRTSRKFGKGTCEVSGFGFVFEMARTIKGVTA
jgi:hypothetical protein